MTRDYKIATSDELHAFALLRNRALSLLRYDKINGALWWRDHSGVPVKVRGKLAGTKSQWGYIQIGIDRKTYKSHQLIWLMEFGYIPPLIDHRDENKENNRMGNLRVATHSQNKINVKKRSVLSSSGIKGCHYVPRTKRWRAAIQKDGRTMHLGYFSTLEQASAARSSAEVRLFGDFSPKYGIA